MALIARHKNGRGQQIEIPLFHAMFTVIGPAGAYVTAKGLHRARPIDVNGSGTLPLRRRPLHPVRSIQSPLPDLVRPGRWISDWGRTCSTSSACVTQRPTRASTSAWPSYF